MHHKTHQKLRKTALFIINPISGGKNKRNIPALIEKTMDNNLYDIDIQFTESAEHNLELAQNAINRNVDILAAVGGDGTINNIAKYVSGSATSLAIVPLGSGNGLARHLKIPMHTQKALELINKGNIQTIDTGMANNQFFVNVAGIGFDAHVSWLFSTALTRGFISYTKITLKEFANYKPEKVTVIIDGIEMVKDAFILCVANGSQYGNNAFISPDADLSDGLLNISVMKPFNPFHLPIIGTQLFTKQFGNSRYIDVLSGKEIRIVRKEDGYLNIDGEPVKMDKEIDIKIIPKSLKVIIP